MHFFFYKKHLRTQFTGNIRRHPVRIMHAHKDMYAIPPIMGSLGSNVCVRVVVVGGVCVCVCVCCVCVCVCVCVFLCVWCRVHCSSSDLILVYFFIPALLPAYQTVRALGYSLKYRIFAGVTTTVALRYCAYNYGWRMHTLSPVYQYKSPVYGTLSPVYQYKV
jgi:hypothetical protein